MFPITLEAASVVSRMFFKIDIPQNFVKFTGKSIFFNKFAGLLQKRLRHNWVFFVDFAKFLRTIF